VGYRRLSAEERVQIEALFGAGLSMAQIAVQVGRHKSTVSRELARNAGFWSNVTGSLSPLRAQRPVGRRGRYNSRYCAQSAHRRAGRLARERWGRRQVKLGPGPLRDRVVAELGQRWSPRQISARLAREYAGHPDAALWSVSAETIYQAVYVQSRGGLREELKDQVALRSGRVRRRARAVPGGPLRSNRSWTQEWRLSTRPAEAQDRAVPGHWEGDLLIGAGGASAIVTLVERSSRYVMLGALPGGRDSSTVVGVLTTLFDQLPAHLRRSLAWDQGSELAQAATFRLATGCPVCFADPHSPWQRGSNENTNGLLRQYFPKGKHSFRNTTQADLDAVATQLNARPRMTLDWATPAETLNHYLVALTD